MKYLTWHFDHVDYFGYDDFASPTQLNSGIQFAASSETSLIGEFRITKIQVVNGVLMLSCQFG